MSKEHIISLVLGDWSDDGHGKTERFTIKSNLSKKEIENAYKLGVEKIGVNLVEEVAEDYENHYIDFYKAEKFVNAGLKLLEWGFDPKEFPYDWNEAQKAFEERASIKLTPEMYLNLYLFIIKMGNSKFKYSIMKNNAPVINIGGYGLFY